MNQHRHRHAAADVQRCRRRYCRRPLVRARCRTLVPRQDRGRVRRRRRRRGHTTATSAPASISPSVVKLDAPSIWTGTSGNGTRGGSGFSVASDAVGGAAGIVCLSVTFHLRGARGTLLFLAAASASAAGTWRAQPDDVRRRLVRRPRRIGSRRVARGRHEQRRGDHDTVHDARCHESVDARSMQGRE